MPRGPWIEPLIGEQPQLGSLDFVATASLLRRSCFKDLDSHNLPFPSGPGFGDLAEDSVPSRLRGRVCLTLPKAAPLPALRSLNGTSQFGARLEGAVKCLSVGATWAAASGQPLALYPTRPNAGAFKCRYS